MITNLLSFIQDCIHSATLSLKTLLYLQEANKEVMDVLVVGSGGGPDETNLSGYLVKSADGNWEGEGHALGLDAGSGLGTLRSLMAEKPRLLRADREVWNSREDYATAIYENVGGFLITHAHLDHIMSLVVSCGSLQGPSKSVYGLGPTLDFIQHGALNNKLWPALACMDSEERRDHHKYVYSKLDPGKEYNSIHPSISVKAYPLNHGYDASGGPYSSSAFLLRHKPSECSLLFFGDVEPDSIREPRRNIEIWREVAPLIPTKLKAIFIECSWPSGREDGLLFGHLTPEHLVTELSALAMEVWKDRAGADWCAALDPDILKMLEGLTVYVTHCKDDPTRFHNRRPHEVITEQVRSLVEKVGLGAVVRAAEQGTVIRASFTTPVALHFAYNTPLPDI